MELLKLFASSMNFTYALVELDDMQFGVLNNGTMTGAVGMLQRGEADLAVGMYSLNEARLKAAHYTL